MYNDATNSPEIRAWLGKTVGRDAEDLSRHDKWLCMMYPRLSLLRLFLREDGVVFVSIDENEEGHLRLLMDEVFGAANALGTFVWRRRSSSAMRGAPLSIDHEYILVYALAKDKATLYGLEKGVDGYPYEDERGRYASTDLTVGMGKDARPGQFFSIKNPKTGVVYEANPERVWRFYPETMQKIIDAGLIIWPDEAGGNMQRPRYKTYYDPENLKPKPVSSWIEASNTNDRSVAEEEAEFDVTVLSTGMNQEGGRLLQQMMGTKVFAYPKPLSLIRSLVRATTSGDDIVMDSFAGTGTAGHAILDLNAEDHQDRRFLLVEMEKDICAKITAERLRRAIEGYEYQPGKGAKKQVAGLGGGFRYCILGEPLFDEHGQVCREVKFADLARHVFFTETGEPPPKATNGKKSPLLGTCRGTAYYLLFNGIMGDKRPNGGNVLTGKLLADLPSHDGQKVIYGEGWCANQ